MNHEEYQNIAISEELKKVRKELEGPIYRPARYIANASENGYDGKNIEIFLNRMVKTSTGKQLIKSIFRL